MRSGIEVIGKLAWAKGSVAKEVWKHVATAWASDGEGVKGRRENIGAETDIERGESSSRHR